MVDNRYHSTTVKSYISAIKYCLMVDGIEVNISNCQLSALVRACHLQNDTIFIRLKLLNRLLNLVKACIILGKGQFYLGRWLRAIFVMAYYGLMRVSELVGCHAVAARNVVYGENKRRVTMYLRSSKIHTTADLPKVIYITGSRKMTSL